MDEVSGAVPVVRFPLETGDVVEVDGGGGPVVVRLPGDRAHAVAHALADWSRVCALVAEAVDTYEQPLADALARAAVAVGDREASTCSARDGRPTVSAQRMAAAAELRRHGDLTAEGLVAVVDAAAGYVDSGGDDAAVALLTAVGGEEAAAAAYAALVTPLMAHRG